MTVGLRPVGAGFPDHNVLEAKHLGAAEFTDAYRTGHLPNLHVTYLVKG
jgi:hypothetical protein